MRRPRVTVNRVSSNGSGVVVVRTLVDQTGRTSDDVDNVSSQESDDDIDNLGGRPYARCHTSAFTLVASSVKALIPSKSSEGGCIQLLQDHTPDPDSPIWVLWIRRRHFLESSETRYATLLLCYSDIHLNCKIEKAKDT
eukprot:COSAG02_NODE_1692_length_11293_cov_12.853940_6_plen_139_part_00